MAVLAVDIDIPHLGTPTKVTVKALAGGDIFYKGALVFADSTAGLAQVLPAAGDSFLGICAENTVAAAGGDVPIYIDGTWALKFVGAAAADVGNTVVVDMDGGALSDNETDLVSAADATIVAGDILIGKCVGLNTADVTRGWVMLHTPSGIANALGWL